jgi:hypothetical protein
VNRSDTLGFGSKVGQFDLEVGGLVLKSSGNLRNALRNFFTPWEVPLAVGL